MQAASRLVVRMDSHSRRPESPLWSLRPDTAEERSRNARRNTLIRSTKLGGVIRESSCSAPPKTPKSEGYKASKRKRPPKPKTGIRRRVLHSTLHHDIDVFDKMPELFLNEDVARADAVARARKADDLLKASGVRPRLVFNYVLGSKRPFSLRVRTQLCSQQ